LVGEGEKARQAGDAVGYVPPAELASFLTRNAGRIFKEEAVGAGKAGTRVTLAGGAAWGAGLAGRWYEQVARKACLTGGGGGADNAVAWARQTFKRDGK
jgi:hypothetical protein